MWVARTDSGASPQELKSNSDETEPAFTNDGTIYFRATEGGKNFLYRMRSDGTGRERVLDTSIMELFSVSRDGSWASILVEGKGEGAPATAAMYSLHDHWPPLIICAYCTLTFSWDGKTTYLAPDVGSKSVPYYAVSTAAVIAEAKKSPGAVSAAHLPGAKPLPNVDGGIAPGPDAFTFAFPRVTVRRNLYRIPVR